MPFWAVKKKERKKKKEFQTLALHKFFDIKNNLCKFQGTEIWGGGAGLF